jgi:hypothetical protein
MSGAYYFVGSMYTEDRFDDVTVRYTYSTFEGRVNHMAGIDNVTRSIVFELNRLRELLTPHLRTHHYGRWYRAEYGFNREGRVDSLLMAHPLEDWRALQEVDRADIRARWLTDPGLKTPIVCPQPRPMTRVELLLEE